MGHVLLAAPTVAHFALTDALLRLLVRRGTRATVLATDLVTTRMFEAHGIATRFLAPSRHRPTADPTLDEFARREVRLASDREDRRVLHRAHAGLARRSAPLVRHFESELPDVVVTFDARSGLARLIHATARIFGCATAHLGEGLLPGTLQRDHGGIDGDREAPLRSDAPADRALLDSALAAALAGGAGRADLPRRVVFPPSLGDRVATWFAAPRDGGRTARRARIAAWREAVGCRETDSRHAPPRLPDAPFVAVLLQRQHDPRVRLDADAPPSSAELIAATRRAAASLGLAERVAVVLPARAVSTFIDGLACLPHDAAPVVAATAAAVVTINDGRAFVGALAGTPTLCLGRAFWARDGLATTTTLARLTDDLRAAMERRADDAQRRTMTAILREEHVWCDGARPDVNGLGGIAAWLEALLARAAPPPPPVRYESGPSWPADSDESE